MLPHGILYDIPSLKYETDAGIAGTKERLYLGGDAYSAAAVYVKEGTGAWAVYYIGRDYQGSITHVIDAAGGVKQELSYDPWGRLRNPTNQQLYAAGSEPVLFLGRGYTGHEHLTMFGLINMNARLYDPVLGRFLSPDPYVQAPSLSQNFNRYAYCLNNPLCYTDQSGEFWWFIPVIASAVFAVGNTVAHAIKGDIHNIGDAFKYFGQGAVTGFALGCAWQFAPLIPWVGNTIQAGMTLYARTQVGIGTLGTITGSFNDGWKGVGNGLKISLGNFYLDENNWLGGIYQGFNRHTLEMPQTFLGHAYTQIRNASGGVDRVDFFGGATFSTSENTGQNDGVTLGNYINMNIRTEITGNFDDYVLSHPLYMHEYGHSIDSRAFGLSYLFAIGIPSIASAAKTDKTHLNFWTETRANRRASKYFKKHFGLNWKFQDYPL